MRARLLPAAVALASSLSCAEPGVPAAEAPPAPESRLFSPDNLGVLESPDRDEWQQPELIMDALNIADGSRVADVGAGGGWFSVRLAHRVGPNGRVFAEDIQPEMIEAIRRRVVREELEWIEAVLGTPTDPRLPSDLQAVLIVDTYPQFEDPVGLLRNVAASLAPNGRLGIVDFTKDGAGGPGPDISQRVDPDVIINDAAEAGLTLDSHETFLRYEYLLVFVKSGT